MNCDQTKRKILLGESGELLEQEVKELDLHLRECTECAQYRKNLNIISSIASEGLRLGEPSEVCMDAIGTYAEQRTRNGKILFYSRPVMLCAYAAAMILAISGWLITQTRQDMERASTVNAIIMVFHETQDSDYSTLEDIGGGEADELTLLAEQLLIIEGLAEDDIIDFELIEPEPETTDLRSRNTPSSPPRICV